MNLKTLTLPNGCTFTLDIIRASGLRNGLNCLSTGTLHKYELADHSIIEGTFEGYDGLNLRFRKSDGTYFLAPIVDMSDGSLVTEYLSEVSR